MRIWHFARKIQLVFLALPLLLALVFTNCHRRADELPITPPATNPLAREYIGYGVVIVSFTHILSESGPSGVSQGYLRRGTVVRIIERRNVINRGRNEFWVLAEANYQTGDALQGWLQASAIEVYDNEDRANTASKTVNQ